MFDKEDLMRKKFTGTLTRRFIIGAITHTL